jgi:hypothetical protein
MIQLLKSKYCTFLIAFYFSQLVIKAKAVSGYPVLLLPCFDYKSCLITPFTAVNCYVLIDPGLDVSVSQADLRLAFAGGCGGVAHREKRASLLQFGIDYGSKKCYRTGLSVSFVFCKKLPLSSIKRRNEGSC